MSSKGLALVTGVSRKKGIGYSICQALAKKGFDIFFTYWTAYDNSMPWKVDRNEPFEIKESVRKMGVKCQSIELDLTKDGQIDSLFTKIHETMGQANILINNATHSTVTTLDSINADSLDDHYQMNIKATMLLIQAFVRQINTQNTGKIVNITSGQSLGEMPNEIAYAMTKGAIETLTKTISQTLASKQITINAVNPGPTNTGWMDHELEKDLKIRFPSGRIGVPKDCANLVAFLCSKEAEWITGQIIHSEGGFIR